MTTTTSEENGLTLATVTASTTAAKKTDSLWRQLQQYVELGQSRFFFYPRAVYSTLFGPETAGVGGGKDRRKTIKRKKEKKKGAGNVLLLIKLITLDLLIFFFKDRH